MRLTDAAVFGSRPVHIVAIGGVDPSGGAGVVRDFLTGRALGASVRIVVTALTEQSPAGVRGIEPRDPAALGQAVRAALLDRAVRGPDPGGDPAADGVVVKIGMLPDDAAVAAVAGALAGFGGPVVLDPVLGASSGGSLFRGDPAALLALATRADLLTPNAPEAAALTGMPVDTLDQATAAAQALCARGARSVLVKGGHLQGTSATDVWVGPAGVRRFSGARRPGGPVRGTGCALATAIAVGLGRGLSVADAIAAGKDWLGDAIAAAVDVRGERHLS